MIKQTWLVAKQVYRTRFKSIGFWSIVLSPILFALIAIGIGWIIGSSSASGEIKLAVVNQPKLEAYIKDSKVLGYDAKVSKVNTLDEAKKELKNEDIDGYLTEKDKKFTLVTSKDSGIKFDESSLSAILTQYQLIDKAADLNLSQDDIKSLQETASLSMQTMDKKGDEASGGDVANAANYAIASVTGVAIFMLLTFYVGIIAQEIANEKSSRIMEILLAATSSKVQYFGKLLGIFLLAVTQLLIYLSTFIVVRSIFKDNEIIKMVGGILNNMDISFAVITIAMVLVALFGYMVLASIVASLVNDQSQAQQATQPVIFLSMIGYILSFIVASSPNNMLIKVLSYIPFVSQTLMPARYAIQYASMNEALIALVIEVVVILVIAILGQKIYARNVLSYSDEKLFRQLLKNFRN